MILTVTPNPAYDVTYTVPRIEPGAVHRVDDVRERAGGKGINVARVLMQLGEPVYALGFGNEAFAADLDTAGVQHDLVLALQRVRRTLVVHAENDTTSFWEPGASLMSPDACDRLCARLRLRLEDADGVVVSGSLPAGADPALPARLARMAIDAGVPVVVDTDGEPLRLAARVPGVVLVPNADELESLLAGTRELTDPLEACAGLLASGARAVVATRGSDGMIAATSDGAWHATPGERVEGNPTGAGDSAAAAIIAQLSRPTVDWPALLADAVATAAAAVASPVAGAIDVATRDRVRPRVVETALPVRRNTP
ncbi:MAG: 1-phosphofructokinase family hexose kinase [Nocardioidaceae bacterium]